MPLIALIFAAVVEVDSPTSGPSSAEADVFDILEEENNTITMGRAPVRLIESGSSAWVIDRTMIENRLSLRSARRSNAK